MISFVKGIVFSKHGSNSENSEANALLFNTLAWERRLLIIQVELLFLGRLAWFYFSNFKFTFPDYINILGLVAFMVHYLIAHKGLLIEKFLELKEAC